MSFQILTELIESHNRIVFFGGAGTSTASGIPDFRSANGLYANQFEGLSPEVILSKSFFYKNPEKFYAFLKTHLYYPEALPNDCHVGLALLEEMGKLKAVITQNIDGLHQKAGSQRVIELHGNMNTLTCLNCKKVHQFSQILNTMEPHPLCTVCHSLLKPEVTLYEEMLDETVVEGAIEAIASADLLIVGGTSLAVYPAAGFIRYFRGEHLVLMNYTETSYDASSQLIFREPIDLVFREAVINRFSQV